MTAWMKTHHLQFVVNLHCLQGMSHCKLSQRCPQVAAVRVFNTDDHLPLICKQDDFQTQFVKLICFCQLGRIHARNSWNPKRIFCRSKRGRRRHTQLLKFLWNWPVTSLASRTTGKTKVYGHQPWWLQNQPHNLLTRLSSQVQWHDRPQRGLHLMIHAHNFKACLNQGSRERSFASEDLHTQGSQLVVNTLLFFLNKMLFVQLWWIRRRTRNTNPWHSHSQVVTRWNTVACCPRWCMFTHLSWIRWNTATPTITSVRMIALKEGPQTKAPLFVALVISFGTSLSRWALEWTLPSLKLEA